MYIVCRMAVADEEMYIIENTTQQMTDYIDGPSYRAFFFGLQMPIEKFDNVRMLLAQFISLYFDAERRKIFKVPDKVMKYPIRYTMEQLEAFKAGSPIEQHDTMVNDTFEQFMEHAMADLEEV